MNSGYGYFRIVKNGIAGDDAINTLRSYDISERKIFYDYGTRDGNLKEVLSKVKYSKLYILRLNDLGFRIQEVINILEILCRYETELYICNRKVNMFYTIFLLKDKMNFFINFDKYPELVGFEQGWM